MEGHDIILGILAFLSFKLWEVQMKLGGYLRPCWVMFNDIISYYIQVNKVNNIHELEAHGHSGRGVFIIIQVGGSSRIFSSQGRGKNKG